MKNICVTAILLMFAPFAQGESATFGWEAVFRGHSAHVEMLGMTGPTARNSTPEKSGVFKGRFSQKTPGEDRPQLVALYKLSLSATDGLVSQKIRHTLATASSASQIASGVTEFETEVLSFETGETFLLIIKNKAETEMLVLPITRLFIPS